MSTILKRKGRDRAKIMAEILAITEEAGSVKSRIMYRANLSFSNLMEYLSILLEMGLLQKVKKGNSTLYKTTDKGRAYLHAYRRLRALMSKSEIAELESRTKTKPEETAEIRSITHIDWFRSEIANLKTRIERLEKTVPKLEFCPACRKEVRPDFRLCPYCGEKLVKSEKVRVAQS